MSHAIWSRSEPTIPLPNEGELATLQFFLETQAIVLNELASNIRAIVAASGRENSRPIRVDGKYLLRLASHLEGLLGTDDNG